MNVVSSACVQGLFFDFVVQLMNELGISFHDLDMMKLSLLCHFNSINSFYILHDVVSISISISYMVKCTSLSLLPLAA